MTLWSVPRTGPTSVDSAVTGTTSHSRPCTTTAAANPSVAAIRSGDRTCHPPRASPRGPRRPSAPAARFVSTVGPEDHREGRAESVARSSRWVANNLDRTRSPPALRARTRVAWRSSRRTSPASPGSTPPAPPTPDRASDLQGRRARHPRLPRHHLGQQERPRPEVGPVGHVVVLAVPRQHVRHIEQPVGRPAAPAGTPALPPSPPLSPPAPHRPLPPIPRRRPTPQTGSLVSHFFGRACSGLSAACSS